MNVGIDTDTHQNVPKERETPIAASVISTSLPPPSFPKFPINLLGSLSAPLPLHPPEIQRHTGHDEGNHNQRLQRLRKHGSTEQEQANTTEDDGCRDPAFVRSLEIWLLNPQYDQSEHGEEIKRIARHAVEGGQGREVADDDICGCHRCVKKHGIGRRVKESSVIGDEPRQPRMARCADR